MIGKHIKSQNDIAKQIGISKAYLSDILKGKLSCYATIKNKLIIYYPYLQFEELTPRKQRNGEKNIRYKVNNISKDSKPIAKYGLYLKEHEVKALEKQLNELKQLKKQKDDVVEYIKEHLTDNGRFLMLNEWQVPDLLRMLGEIDE